VDDSLPQRAIDAIHGAMGSHAGRRAVHSRGGWCQGTLTGTEEGRALCRAPFLGGEPVRALVRFSNGSGDPGQHDGVRDGRGMATKLFLPDGTDTDLVMISVPAFTSRTPEDFVELIELMRRDPESGQPDLARVGPFLEAHPETMAAVQARLGRRPPASWLALAYNGIHAFAYTAPDGTRRWVRTRFVPDAGEEEIDDEEAMARSPDYLAADLRERLAAGPVRFTLIARLAAEGDPLDDPTAAWPEERETVAIAHLVLEAAVDDPESPGDIHVFDPMRLCDGVEPSGDPILRFRPHAYDVSARLRMG
jgi:catalase